MTLQMSDEQNPYFGRKYQVIVSDASGNALDVSELHCTFVVEKVANQKAGYADISIYNLDLSTLEAIVKEGSTVILSAGYEHGAFGKIFEGELFQPTIERENVTDLKLTLHCIDGNNILNSNFVNFSLGKGYNYRDVILKMANSARNKMTVGGVTDTLDQKQTPRGKVVFGDPRDTFRQICRDNNATFFADNGKLYVTKITDVPKGEALVISPESGLIGTPQQTDEGFSFRCLLNPSVQVINGENTQMLVKLDNSIIRQEKVQIGQYTSLLDQDMVGKVIGVTYIGDTRGDDWYCDVTCVNRGGKIPLQLAQG